jgi:flagellin
MLTSGISFAGSTGQFVQNIDRNTKRVAVSVEQLSTGKRINRPSDDPAGFVAAEEIRGELIELHSETRAATHRRVHFLQQQADYSHIQATLVEDRGQLGISAEQPINIDENVVPDVTPGASYAAASGSRIEEVFTELREDKEVILTEALSLIEDTDFAAATAELVNGQILSQASFAALAYATQQMTDQMSEIMSGIDVTVE